MAHDQSMVHVLYRKLICLYPRGFRQRFSESMEQTFNDLYNENKRGPQHELFSFVLWTLIETTIGIIKEHILVIRQGYTMKNILINHNSAAATGLILSMPIGLIYIVFIFDITLLIGPLKSLLTINGYEVNILGRIVIMGGLLLLPVAFVINLLPMLKRAGPEQKRTFHAINLIVGVILLLLILFTWGGLFLEEIYCLQGIRCD